MSPARRLKKQNFYMKMHLVKAQTNHNKRCWSREVQLNKVRYHHDRYSKILNLRTLFETYQLCRTNVSWKRKIQAFNQDIFSEICELYYYLACDTLVPIPYHRFRINERGKIRDITSPDISERVIQVALFKRVLAPILTPNLIYDNGASLVGKGVEFARRRIIHHLSQYYRKYGYKGWVLCIDFKKYFENIDHRVAMELLSKRVHDPRVLNLCAQILNKQEVADKPGIGLGLGSQLSQIIAIYYPSKMDHVIKEKFRMKYYGRYMDDSYIIHYDRAVLEQVLEAIRWVCAELKITLSPNKTKIVRLENGFTFLKTKYFLEPDGKVVRISGRDSAKRERRKLRKFLQRYKLPETDKYHMSLEQITTTYNSWKGFINSQFDAHNLLRRMDRYFEKLFKVKPPRLTALNHNKSKCIFIVNPEIKKKRAYLDRKQQSQYNYSIWKRYHDIRGGVPKGFMKPPKYQRFSGMTYGNIS